MVTTLKRTVREYLFNNQTGMLASVRKIIAILMTLVFCYLSVRGIIQANEFIPIFSMVLGYYFGKSTALDDPKQGVVQPEIPKEHIEDDTIKYD